jgi:hypothetical protein
MNLEQHGQDGFRGKIAVHILFGEEAAQSVVFWDNGCGMNRDDLKSYATYSYSTEAREKDAGVGCAGGKALRECFLSPCFFTSDAAALLLPRKTHHLSCNKKERESQVRKGPCGRWRPAGADRQHRALWCRSPALGA